MKKTIAVLRWIVGIVLILILLLNLAVIGIRAVVASGNGALLGIDAPEGAYTPVVFGYSWAVVLSGSMEPALSVDDLVISKAQEQYAVEDIVTFYSGKGLVTHRITGQADGGFITKGDANNVEDAGILSQSQIVGKVVYTIPNVGPAIEYVKSPLGMGCLIAMGLLLIEIPYTIESLKTSEERRPKDEESERE